MEVIVNLDLDNTSEKYVIRFISRNNNKPYPNNNIKFYINPPTFTLLTQILYLNF